MLQWNDLHLLLMLRRHTTMAQAAQVMGVNVSTISRRLATLQRDMGTTFFERTSQGCVPTQAALEPLKIAARMEEQALTLERQVIGQDAEIRGEVTISTIALLASDLSPIFAQLCRDHPQLKLVLNTTQLMVNLSRRDADIVVRLTNNPPEHLVGRRIGPLRFALYGSEDLLKDLPESPVIRDIERLPWLQWAPSFGAVGTAAWINSVLPLAKRAAQVDNTSLMREYIRAGVGVAFMPSMSMFECTGTRPLVQMPEELDAVTYIWILTHPDLLNAGRIKVAMDALEHALRERFERATLSVSRAPQFPEQYLRSSVP